MLNLSFQPLTMIFHLPTRISVKIFYCPESQKRSQFLKSGLLGFTGATFFSESHRNKYRVTNPKPIRVYRNLGKKGIKLHTADQYWDLTD
jgi:hypothetical protein